MVQDEILAAIDELSGFIYKALKEDNPENKRICAMHIALRIRLIRRMIEKCDHFYVRAEETLSIPD
jgi:hypothetical protein